MPEKPAPHVTIGQLGWGNRKNGLEAYGEGGRWGEGRDGDLLGDALEREGQHEGANLVVIVLPRFCPVDQAAVAEQVRALMAGWFENKASPLEYLDMAIRSWRADTSSDPAMRSHYIDAFQSARVSIFGELLPEDESSGE